MAVKQDSQHMRRSRRERMPYYALPLADHHCLTGDSNSQPSRQNAPAECSRPPVLVTIYYKIKILNNNNVIPELNILGFTIILFSGRRTSTKKKIPFIFRLPRIATDSTSSFSLAIRHPPPPPPNKTFLKLKNICT